MKGTEPMPTIIKRSNRFAVSFTLNGRSYQTLFTSFAAEAEAWVAIIAQHGWCASSRPMRAN
jgi:hypothetical protein